MTDLNASIRQQAQKALDFQSLHIPGKPLELYNIWDPGSARAVTDAGATALATGSWSVAAAQGFADGEELPLELLLSVTRRIAATSDLPLTVDFETGFDSQTGDLAGNLIRLIEAGAIGVNIEDRIIGDGLRTKEEQVARLTTLRNAATSSNVPVFINARTDLFLKEKDETSHAALVGQALERAAAYASAGASGLFVPGLIDPELIRQICEGTKLPVNVMMKPGAPSRARLADIGVARISHGPFPYIEAMERLREKAATVLS